MRTFCIFVIATSCLCLSEAKSLLGATDPLAVPKQIINQVNIEVKTDKEAKVPLMDLGYFLKVFGVGLNNGALTDLSTLQLYGTNQTFNYLVDGDTRTYNYNLNVGFSEFKADYDFNIRVMDMVNVISKKVEINNSGAYFTVSGHIVVEDNKCSGTLDSTKVAGFGKFTVEVADNIVGNIVGSVLQFAANYILPLFSFIFNYMIDEITHYHISQETISTVLCSPFVNH